MLSVQVWDKDNVKLVEKAIRESELGLNPQLDGQLLRMMPALVKTAELNYQKFAKYAENAKITVEMLEEMGWIN